jgi:hypothetical protein
MSAINSNKIPIKITNRVGTKLAKGLFVDIEGMH